MTRLYLSKLNLCLESYSCIPFMRENNEAREQEPLPMTLLQAYVVERER